MALDYRTLLLQLTQLWYEDTPESREAFHVLLALAERERGRGPKSARGALLEGGTLEHCVWGGFSQTLADSEFQNTETIDEIAAYVTHRRSYTGRAYICFDYRPDMREDLLRVHEEAAVFLKAVGDREYLLQAERGELDARREHLIAAWRALPEPTTWKQRTVCAEVMRQVFDLLIYQMYFPGHRIEVWARAPLRMMMDPTKHPHPNLLPLVPWGRRALNALLGTGLVQLTWVYEDGHIAFTHI